MGRRRRLELRCAFLAFVLLIYVLYAPSTRELDEPKPRRTRSLARTTGFESDARSKPNVARGDLGRPRSIHRQLNMMFEGPPPPLGEDRQGDVPAREVREPVKDYKTPQTTLIAHTPGWTVLDSVMFLNGTLYIVVDDDADGFPSAEAIVSPTRDGSFRAEMITLGRAHQLLARPPSKLRGVSWMMVGDALDYNSNNLLGLWHLHDALQHYSVSSSHPARLILPRLSFTESRSSSLSRRLIHATFPSLGLLYKDDWRDMTNLSTPFILERVVLADPRVASAATTLHCLPSPTKGWWEPARRAFAHSIRGAQRLHPAEPSALQQLAPAPAQLENDPVRWSEQQPTAPMILWLYEPGHVRVDRQVAQELVHELQVLGQAHGWTINLLPITSSPHFPATKRLEHLRAAAQATVVFGVSSPMLSQTLLTLRPNTTFLEIFPPPLEDDMSLTNSNTQVNPESALWAQALDVRHVGWKDNALIEWDLTDDNSDVRYSSGSSSPLRQIHPRQDVPLPTRIGPVAEEVSFDAVELTHILETLVLETIRTPTKTT